MAGLIMATNYFLRAWRWRNLLLTNPMPSFFHRYEAVKLGFFANSILPLRIGEFLRPLVLERRAHVPYSVGLASLLLERICDGYTLLFLLGITALLAQQNTLAVIGPGVAAIIMTLLGTGLIIVLWTQGKRAARRMRIIVHRFSPRAGVKVEHALIRFSESLPVWSSPSKLLRIFSKSLLVWLVIALTVVPAAEGFGILDKMPYWGPLLIMVFTVMGVSIPSAPANLGVFELSTAGGLMVALPGMDWSAAVGFGMLLHVAQLLPVYIIGLYFIWRGETSLLSTRSLVRNNH